MIPKRVSLATLRTNPLLQEGRIQTNFQVAKGTRCAEELGVMLNIWDRVSPVTTILCILPILLAGGAYGEEQGSPRWGQDTRDPLNQLDAIDARELDRTALFATSPLSPVP